MSRAPDNDTCWLLPLLMSISREIEERCRSLAALEQEMEELDGTRPDGLTKLRRLTAEASVQRREMRHAFREIERLGCSIVGHAPLTFRIPIGRGDRSRSMIWQMGDSRSA